MYTNTYFYYKEKDFHLDLQGYFLQTVSTFYESGYNKKVCQKAIKERRIRRRSQIYFINNQYGLRYSAPRLCNLRYLIRILTHHRSITE